MSDVEFWTLTLYEVHLLSIRHRQVQEREDRRAAFGGWLLVNINRDTERKSEPFDLEQITSWLGYSGNYVKRQPVPVPEPEAPASSDEIQRKFELIYQLHQLTQQNGDQG